jgi:hypothetical protein
MITKIENIFTYLSKINTHDKLSHFFYGFFIFNISLIFLSFFWSLAIVSIVALTKETYDYKIPNHESSILDFTYTVLPGVFQTVLSLI